MTTTRALLFIDTRTMETTWPFGHNKLNDTRHTTQYFVTFGHKFFA
jgi:hypothetical protein